VKLVNAPSEICSAYISRRNFLRTSASAAGILLAPSLQGFAQRTAATSGHPLESNPTPDAALKFTPGGMPKPFAGNTVICHVPHQSRFMDGASALQDALQSANFAHKLGILPPESYHMTIFPGANDQARPRSSWPGGVALDATIEQCSSIMRQRMESVHLEGPFPLRVEIDVPATMNYGRACTLRMKGADPNAEHTLRAIRNRLADVYQYRGPEHDNYGFHITIAYTMTDLSAEEMTHYHALLQDAVNRLTRETPVLSLGLPEYCTFRDMFRFDTEVILRSC
jgi:hypothetical protein